MDGRVDESSRQRKRQVGCFRSGSNEITGGGYRSTSAQAKEGRQPILPVACIDPYGRMYIVTICPSPPYLEWAPVMGGCSRSRRTALARRNPGCVGRPSVSQSVSPLVSKRADVWKGELSRSSPPQETLGGISGGGPLRALRWRCLMRRSSERAIYASGCSVPIFKLTGGAAVPSMPPRPGPSPSA